MPIGVPKVPFRLPGEPAAQWVDLYNRLYRERVLFLCQELDDELANQLIGIMLYLNAEEKSKGLFIYINSPGGSVTCGIAVYDTMNYVKAEVTTICVGTAASMASFVLAGGDRGKRLALPHSRIMIHQPLGGARGQASDIQIQAQEIQDLKKQLTQIYVDHTSVGKTFEDYEKSMDRDNYLNPGSAKEMGLIDVIIEPKGKLFKAD
jgi:ATP-dependent Clp protease protease subunit